MNDSDRMADDYAEQAARERAQHHLADTDPMPFGQHKGKMMSDVPVGYLHWLWHNGLQTTTRPQGVLVADYIRRNLAALQMENRDLIWS